MVLQFLLAKTVFNVINLNGRCTYQSLRNRYLNDCLLQNSTWEPISLFFIFCQLSFQSFIWPKVRLQVIQAQSETKKVCIFHLSNIMMAGLCWKRKQLGWDEYINNSWLLPGCKLLTCAYWFGSHSLLLLDFYTINWPAATQRFGFEWTLSSYVQSEAYRICVRWWRHRLINNAYQYFFWHE